ncbi:MAG TPA: hypothetical protein VJU58_07565, partial [Microbacterium sp.]|nr:hypothetical protein [Microbacterium sp.]
MSPGTPVRSLVLWFPDWPVTALEREAGAVKPEDAVGERPGAPSPAAHEKSGAKAPVAVVERNLVVACSVSARAEGVRRGQRRRDAQARCPGLTLVAADAARDHRAFA